jgi:sugar phosphate isomerase/epimerase
VKLSCLPVSMFPEIVSGRMPIAEWARLAADVGLDGLDLSVLFLKSLDVGYLDGVRAQIADAGQRVVMLATYPDFTHPDAAERTRQIEQEIAHIHAAGRLGAELVRATAGQAHPGLREADGMRWALQGLRACVPAAKEAGVTLVLENHNKPGSWQYTDFDTPAPVFLALAEALRDSGIGIHFDTANPIAAGADTMDLLEEVLDQVVSIHAADTAARGHLEPTLLGTGLAPLPQVFCRLKETEFAGWVCIEEAASMGAEGVRRAVRYCRDMWQQA